MKILCHVGPWSRDQYLAIAAAAFPGFQHTAVSGHRHYDDTGLMTRFHGHLDAYRDEARGVDAEERDVILRCRLLRALPVREAARQLRCMRQALREVLAASAPGLVLSETIDSYLMDLLFLECHRAGIQCIGLVPTFVNGYYRLSARGEYVRVRDAETDEVQKVISTLSDIDYQPSFTNVARRGLNKAVLRRWLRNAIKPAYFALRRLQKVERYNYHYWATQLVSSQVFHLVPRFSLGQEDWKQRLEAAASPSIFVPLQMIPEATVDYWCEVQEAVDYNRYLLALIDSFPGFTFVIKEHPNVLGVRHPLLYRELLARPNVIFAPTSVASNLLVGVCDAVLVWTGSVGFEAALRGKPVLTVCDPYYKSGRSFKSISTASSPQELRDFIQSYQPLSEPEKYALAAHLMDGLLPGQYSIDGSWSSDSAADRSNAERIGLQIRDHVLQSQVLN